MSRSFPALIHKEANRKTAWQREQKMRNRPHCSSRRVHRQPQGNTVRNRVVPRECACCDESRPPGRCGQPRPARQPVTAQAGGRRAVGFNEPRRGRTQGGKAGRRAQGSACRRATREAQSGQDACPAMGVSEADHLVLVRRRRASVAWTPRERATRARRGSKGRLGLTALNAYKSR
jgi:hypothetical protein